MVILWKVIGIWVAWVWREQQTSQAQVFASVWHSHLRRCTVCDPMSSWMRVQRDGRWKYGGGSLPEIRVRLELALSNVAVHWTVKVDLWISKNLPIVDIRSSRRRWSTSLVLWRTTISGMWGSKLKIPSQGGTPRRASRWQSLSN